MAVEILVRVRERAWDEFLVSMSRWSAPDSLVSECLVHTGVRRLSDAIERCDAWCKRWSAGYLPCCEVWLEGKVCVFAMRAGSDWSLHENVRVYGGPAAPGRYVWREGDSTWRLAAPSER